MQFVERVKTEIHQEGYSKTGGGTSVQTVLTIHQPMKITFSQTAEGRGSKLKHYGGTNLGEIDDPKYFTNKLVRGLRIPSSYYHGSTRRRTKFQ